MEMSQQLPLCPSSLDNHQLSYQLPPFIHDYFQIPDHLDKFEILNARKLSDSQKNDIHLEVQGIISEQIRQLNPKKEKLYQDIKTSKYPFRKMFLCTAWMRGFCMFPMEDCIHAHGIADLKYSKEDRSADVNKNYKFIDHKQLISKLSYVHLYEFSKLYHLPETSANTEITLEEIFLYRGLRTFIRENIRIKLFEDFFLLLVKTYSGMFLTEEFVSWEFSRVGAGSDALGFNIKSKRISNILSRNLCYIAKAYHPPSLNHYFNMLILRDSRLILHQYFKEKVIQALTYLHKKGEEMTEQNIKKFVNESQITLIEPSFESYLVKDNMCFFRFFKFYSLLDPNFLETCEKIGRIPTDYQAKLSQNQFEINDQKHENIISEQEYSLISSIQFDCCSEMSQKTQRKAKLIEEYLALQFKTHKRKLCRYWLRGQCMFDKSQCQFSHGIDDLIYEKYGEDIEDPEYTEFAFQKSLWLELSFISLFKEQPNLIKKGLLDKEYSLIELDDKKELREKIRAIMQQDTMEEFMELIWQTYGNNIILTQSFLIREFKRVGFFKIGYSLKNQGIFDILNITKTFPSMRVMPPLVEPGVVFLPFPTYQESLQKIYFKVFEVLKLKLEQENNEISDNQDEKSQTEKDISQNQEESDAIKEGQQLDNQELDADSFKEEEEQEQEATSKLIINEFEIKKEFYKNPDLNVPPIYQISKRFGKQVHEIIWDIFDLPEFQTKVKESFPDFDILTLKNSLLLDSDLELLSQRIEEQLTKRQHKISISFWKLFGEIYPEFRPRVRASSTFAKFRDGFRNILETKLQFEFFNLGNSKQLLQKKYILNQIKHEKSLEKKKNSHIKPQTSDHTNENDSSDMFYLNQYLKDQYQFNPTEVELLHRIIVVNTPEGVKEALSKLSCSTLIGVDLEGNLSQSGRIELVQMSQYDFKKNQAIIYVFDCLAMDALKEIKQAVKSIMENQSITKILQGCQKDALALYHLFDSKIINAIDTQVVHNFIVQLKDLIQKEKLAKSSKKNTLKSKSVDPIYYNCGLNIILQIYKAPNGPNPLKNKFHAIFLDHELSQKILLQRPLDTDYLVYSSKDVEDLIPVYALMVKETADLLRQIFPGIESNLVEQIMSNVSKVSYKYKVKRNKDQSKDINLVKTEQ